MIRISNIKMPIDHSEEMLLKKAENCIRGYKIEKMNIVRRSLDCRKKQDIHFVYSVDVTVEGALNSKAEEKIIKKVNNKNIMLTNPVIYNKMPVATGDNIPFTPVIVGSGPAGYFSALLLAKNVDGVYDSDPATNPDAKRYKTITHTEVLEKDLKVMDATAASLCRDNKIKIHVFGLAEPDAILRACAGEDIGTLIY